MNYRSVKIGLCLIALISGLNLGGIAQDGSGGSSNTSSAANAVPHIVNYSGVLDDANGQPITTLSNVTFALYQNQEGGTALWTESQNVQPNSTGRYSVTLGSTTAAGLPEDVFVSSEARWLGVQIAGQAEQARVLLVAVPYALKAGDAQTIGGLPASAFVLAGSQSANGTTNSTGGKSSAAKNNATPANPDVTGKGTIDYIPMWDTTGDIIDSLIYQKTSKVGINTTSPAVTLDVDGKTDVRDTLTLYPSGTDNPLAVNGTSFKVSSTGQVTFISGQTFPGAGTLTGITTASGSGLSGGGTSGTLSLKVPSAGISNTMLANSKVTLNATTAGGLTVPGAMTLGSSYTIGLKTCATNQVLQYSGSVWNCATLGGTGTVTSVASGSGLTGGPITTSGTLSIANSGVTNAMLAHSSLTVTAGTGLTGGGSIALGGTGTLNINTSVIPELSAANTFTNNQSINANNSSAGITVNNTSFGDGIDIYTSGGEGIYIDSEGDGIDSFATYDGAFLYGADTGSYSYTYNNEAFSTGAFGSNFGGTAETIGLYGYSSSNIGIGVYGQSVDASTTGQNNDSGYYAMGVWGDSGQQYGFGVYGTADDGWSFVGYNNSPSGFANTWLENQQTSYAYSPVLFAYGEGFGGECTLDSSGDVNCNGSISGVVPVQGGAKKAALNAIQSPEHWFEDAGSGQLSNGEATISIESVFGETINTGVEYHVFLTPNGDCKGLYVAQKSATSFVVKELGGGTSSIAFDYRIMAKRKGFEQIRLADRTEAMSLAHRPVKPANAATKHMPTAQETLKNKQAHAKMAKLAQNGAPILPNKR
jgi:hypothetical protein